MKKILLVSALLGMVAYESHGEILRLGGSSSTSDPEKVFITVKNSDASALTAGDLVKLDVSDDDGVGVVETTAAADVPLCMMDEACAVGAFCKCQTYGFTNKLRADGTGNATTAGGKITASAYDGHVDGGTGTFVGVALDATSSASTTIEAFIQLR